MAAKLYGNYKSKAFKVLWLAEELGLKLDLVPVLQSFRSNKAFDGERTLRTNTPAFAAINPAGTIPVLDDGFILTESNAICGYLSRQHGGPVAPADAREEALVQQWGYFASSSIEPLVAAIGKVHMEGRAQTAAGARDIADAAEQLMRPLKTVDDRLGQSIHCMSARFTTADILLAYAIQPLANMPSALEPFSHLRRWLNDCRGREAFAAVWSRRMNEPD
jgi:glutathione S-transferase